MPTSFPFQVFGPSTQEDSEAARLLLALRRMRFFGKCLSRLGRPVGSNLTFLFFGIPHRRTKANERVLHVDVCYSSSLFVCFPFSSTVCEYVRACACVCVANLCHQQLNCVLFGQKKKMKETMRFISRIPKSVKKVY